MSQRNVTWMTRTLHHRLELGQSWSSGSDLELLCTPCSAALGKLTFPPSLFLILSFLKPSSLILRQEPCGGWARCKSHLHQGIVCTSDAWNMPCHLCKVCMMLHALILEGHRPSIGPGTSFVT